MRREASIAGAVLAAGLGAACGDPLDLGQVIERTRPVGVRVSVDDDAARAWPAPGETATARFWVAYPRAPVELSWALSVCVAEDARSGSPTCASDPIATAESGPTLDFPAISFQVPDERTLGGAAFLALSGVFCERGTPDLRGDVEGARCAGASAATIRVSADVAVQVEGSGNDNPDLSDDPIELDGELWEATTALAVAGSPCVNEDMLPAVSARQGSRRVTLQLEGDREALEPDESLLGDPRETLAVSHFSTDGELERQYSFVEADDERPAPSVAVEWSPPEAASLPEEGRVVRFVFALRDGRGGADFTERALCALP